MTASEALITFNAEYNGNIEQARDALKRQEDVGTLSCQAILQQQKDLLNLNSDVKVITATDNGFPDAFINNPYCPLVLFYMGDISLLSSKNIVTFYSETDKNTMTEYGKRAAAKATLSLKANDVLLSDIRYAPNCLAQQIAANRNKKSVVMLFGSFGNGEIIPDLATRVVKQGGCVVSTMPIGCPNYRSSGSTLRIQSAISKATLAIELGTWTNPDFYNTNLRSFSKNYAVVHDMTSANPDTCNTLIANYGFIPFFGKF